VRRWSRPHECHGLGLVQLGLESSVERVFSESGLLMRPNRARMSDKTLEERVFHRHNDDV